jgi:hypothetical protein
MRIAYIADVKRLVAAYRARGGRIVTTARNAHVASPVAGGIANAALLVSADRRFAFLDIVNYGRTSVHTHAAHVHEGTFSAFVPAETVAARSAVLLPLGAAAQSARAGSAPVTAAPRSSIARDDTIIPLRPGSWVTAHLRSVDKPSVSVSDVYSDGYPDVVLENGALRIVVSPCAGARVLVAEDKTRGENLFTTVGGLRDTWKQQLQPSPRDYIAKYTHPIATGTFNRCYAYRINNAARSATFTYSAPDAPPHGATFRKTVTLTPSGFTVALDARFANATRQRAQQLTSFAITPATRLVRLANAVGFFEQSKQRLVAVYSPKNDVETMSVHVAGGDALVTFTYAPGAARQAQYRVLSAKSPAEAQAELQALANRR